MKFKNILICRTDRIGDVLLSTPVISALRKQYPSAAISFLTSRYAAVVLKNNPFLKEIFYIEDNNLLLELKKRKFDLALVLFPEFKVCKTVYLSNIPLRIGPANKWFVPIFLNKPVFQHRSRVEKHEADYNLDLLKPLGIKPEDTETYYVIPEDAKRFVKDWKIKNNISANDRFVIIHPGMKGSALNWPLGYYAELADKLICDKKAKVLLSYGPGEENIIKDLVKLMKETPFVIDKTIDLSLLAGFISEADILFCPSTGILHLAVAVKTRTVSIFSPILVQSKKRWGPYGKGHVVIDPAVNCKEKYKCHKNKCLYYNCMEKITVNTVYDKISGMLKV
ncbi:MAG: glycosyltransferase family 9 protein [bacterium]|nr:glycosyltransferase family 9 protein [bacterium]